MTSSEKNTNLKKSLKKKVIIFDLDGVLIDSKKNMKQAWSQVQKDFNLEDKKFESYFEKIGQPFEKILEQLKITKNKKKIKQCYDSSSIKNIKYIKFYPGIKKILKLIYKTHDLCIVTSKDKLRTNIILKDINFFFKIIQCPTKNIKGKPHPDQLLKVITELKVKKNQCIYIGDTYIDFLAAKNAKIDFLFASWGYGRNNHFKKTLKNIKELYHLFSKKI